MLMLPLLKLLQDCEQRCVPITTKQVLCVDLQECLLIFEVKHSTSCSRQMPFFVVLPATLDKLRKNLKQRLLGRGVERQFFGASAWCSNPLAEDETFFLRQLSLVLLAILKALAPLGAGLVSSLLQSSFE